MVLFYGMILTSRAIAGMIQQNHNAISKVNPMICSLGEEPVKITKEASSHKFLMRFLKNVEAKKKQELTQIIKHSLKAI